MGLTAENEEGNYICLNKDQKLVGRLTEADTTNWGPAPSDPDNPPDDETPSACSGDYCWVKSQSDQYHIYTLKKPGKQPVDIVSTIEEWIFCNETNVGPLEFTSDPFSGQVGTNLNHFYCYKEGSHWIKN